METSRTEARRKEEPIHNRRGLKQSLPGTQSRDTLALLGHISTAPVGLSSQRCCWVTSSWAHRELAAGPRPEPPHSTAGDHPRCFSHPSQALSCSICKASAQAEYNPAKQKALWTFQRQSKHDFHHLIHPGTSPIKRDYAGHMPNPVSLSYGGQAGCVYIFKTIRLGPPAS